MKRNYLLIACASLAISLPSASAQNNSFFGQSNPGGPPGGMEPDAGYQQMPGGRSTASGGMNAPREATPKEKSDFTDDEKRMQKKYKAAVQHCKDLIEKGTSMMKDGERKHDDKTYKKGKVFKEIGEKQLAELEANSPFPPKDESKDADNKDKGDKNSK